MSTFFPLITNTAIPTNGAGRVSRKTATLSIICRVPQVNSTFFELWMNNKDATYTDKTAKQFTMAPSLLKIPPAVIDKITEYRQLHVYSDMIGIHVDMKYVMHELHLLQISVLGINKPHDVYNQKDDGLNQQANNQSQHNPVVIISIEETAICGSILKIIHNLIRWLESLLNRLLSVGQS